MNRFKYFIEDAPVNATGPNVVGTGDDDSTVVVKKKIKVYRRKKRMTEKEIEEARNYAKERENYHSKPEEMERNAARLRARRKMIKAGKAARGDGKDVHHKDNNPLNNEEDNLKMTTQAWNRREPRLRKEESINISERELTPTELKRREEIATDLDDAKFKEKYGDKWKQVKMGVATNMAKKESIEEADDPKADKAKAKELKIAKAIAQAQLAIAKEQERVQKLTDLQNKVKGQQTEETTMSKKYLNTKQGSIEDVIKQVWQNAAQASPAAAPPRVENKKVEEEDEEVQPDKKSERVDGRSKSYKETLKRIAIRKEKILAMSKSAKKMEAIADAIDEENLDEGLVEKAVALAQKMGGNMTGAVEAIEKMKKGLSKDKKVAAALQDANEETIKEGDKEEYQKFFKAALKKFGAKSPAEMDDEKKKKFFDYIEKNWTKDEQQEFSEGELPPALKKAIAAKKAKSKGKEDEDEDVSEGELPPALKKAIAAKKAKKNGDEEDEDEDPVGDKKEEKEVITAGAVDDLRKIVDKKQHGKVSGTKVDLFSASAMVQVFDALNSKNQKKVEQMLKSKQGVATFAEFAMSNVK